MRIRKTPFRTYSTALDLDDATESWIATLSTPPPISVQIIANDLIVGMKADNIWNSLRILGLPFLVIDAAQELDSLKNLKGAPHATRSHSTMPNVPTFVPGEGWQLNGTTNYVRLGAAPSGISGWSASNGMFFTWVTAGGNTATTGKNGSGDNLNASQTATWPWNVSGGSRSTINQATHVAGGVVTTRYNFSAGNRSASTSVQNYRNGQPDGTGGTLGGTPNTRELYVGAYNNNGVAADFLANTISAWGAGVSMNAAAHLALYNRITAAKAAIDLL